MHRIDTEELLDEHHAPAADMERSLRDLRRINKYLGGTRVYRKMVARLFANSQEPRANRRILDLGAGTADLLDALGVRFTIAVDINLRHLLYKRERSRARRVVADAQQLPFRDASVDAVTSSHFFHHFSPAENSEIVREALRVAGTGVAFSDTRRNLWPWLFTRLIGALRLVGRITRYDGPASVRRGYTTAEARAIAAESGAAKVEVLNFIPYRWVMLLWKRT